MVVAMVLGGVATVFTVFGQPLGEALRDSLPFGGTVFVAVWTVVRWVLAIAVMVGAELNAEIERQGAIRAGEVAEVFGEGQERPSMPVASGEQSVAPQSRMRSGAPQDDGVSQWTKRMEELRPRR